MASPAASTTTCGPWALSFATTQTGWIGGSGGYVCKTSDGGANWSLQYNAGTIIRALWTIDTSTVYAAGSGGALLKTTIGGANWSTQTSGTSVMLFRLSFLNPSQGYFVGDLGTILRTTDGGAQSSGTPQLPHRHAGALLAGYRFEALAPGVCRAAQDRFSGGGERGGAARSPVGGGGLALRASGDLAVRLSVSPSHVFGVDGAKGRCLSYRGHI